MWQKKPREAVFIFLMNDVVLAYSLEELCGGWHYCINNNSSNYYSNHLQIRCFLHQVLLSLKTKCLFEPKSTALRMKSPIQPRKKSKTHRKNNNLIINTSRKLSFLTAKPACIAGVRTYFREALQLRCGVDCYAIPNLKAE